MFLLSSDADHQELLVVDILSWCCCSAMTLSIKNYLLLIFCHCDIGKKWHWTSTIICHLHSAVVLQLSKDTDNQTLFRTVTVLLLSKAIEHQTLNVVNILPHCFLLTLAAVVRIKATNGINLTYILQTFLQMLWCLQIFLF